MTAIASGVVADDSILRESLCRGTLRVSLCVGCRGVGRWSETTTMTMDDFLTTQTSSFALKSAEGCPLRNTSSFDKHKYLSTYLKKLSAKATQGHKAITCHHPANTSTIHIHM